MEIKIQSVGHGLGVVVALGAQLVGAVLTLGMAGAALMRTGTIDEATAKTIWLYFAGASFVSFLAAVSPTRGTDQDDGGALGRMMGAQFLTLCVVSKAFLGGGRSYGSVNSGPVVYYSTYPPSVFVAVIVAIQFGAPLAMLAWDRWRGGGTRTLGPGPSG